MEQKNPADPRYAQDPDTIRNRHGQDEQPQQQLSGSENQETGPARWSELANAGLSIYVSAKPSTGQESVSRSALPQEELQYGRQYTHGPTQSPAWSYEFSIPAQHYSFVHQPQQTTEGLQFYEQSGSFSYEMQQPWRSWQGAQPEQQPAGITRNSSGLPLYKDPSPRTETLLKRENLLCPSCPLRRKIH
ncbi:hypothetical protein P389DRAFT_24923 [Cystobasidium minutum MCA 4210]|uniref:uncharacterized protein n=1 Tax=Cystobasidium minutum MCA 4210 TaxID=1397322 RepID=UPI0034CD2D60|eukprot:jgi/Rhomi1/24923/CE24922_5639